MKKENKPLSKGNLAQLGVILGQLSYLQPATFNSKRVYLLDEVIFDTWLQALREIIDKESNVK